jgi:hypothetical protein
MQSVGGEAPIQDQMPTLPQMILYRPTLLFGAIADPNPLGGFEFLAT